MRVLIVGSSGKTGQQLLAQLSKIHYSITGLIRSSDQEALVKQFGATPLLGDLEGEVVSLVEGFDAIIFVAGSRGKNVQGVDYQGLVNMVNAAAKAEIKRFLYIGSINAGKEPGQFIRELESFYQENNEPIPEGLLANTQKPGYHTYVKMKAQAEKHIINSGLNYTILRAGLLTQEVGSGKVSITQGTLYAFGKISRDNVAACFIEAMENENTYRKIYTVLDGDTAISNAFKLKCDQ